MRDKGEENVQARSLRITFKAFGFGHEAEITRDTLKARVTLIDITPEGARLNWIDARENPLEPGDHFALNILIEQLGLETGKIPCEVRWRHVKELGVRFISPLEMSVGELQRCLSS